MVIIFASLIGAILGMGTNYLNQKLTQREEEATKPPLPKEIYWAPFLNAIFLGLAAYRWGFSVTGLVVSVVIVLLVQIFVFDARHRLILNIIIYPAMLAALAFAYFNPLLFGEGFVKVWSAGLGALLAGGIFLGLVIVSRGGLGLGDAKLVFFLGAILGVLPFPGSPILRALIYGICLGGIISVLLLLTRIRKMKDFIPYGPFLCLGGILVLLYPCGFGLGVSC
jgi:leader peptidase (prepilin peptidase)/N-methyltransferase